IKEYQTAFVSERISMVMQKAILFSGSIKDNLRWGKKDATDEEIEVALKNSMSYEFVDKLENKTDTILYQGGSNLSGGQKQRLSIARALVKDSPILILDDSSSALDFKTEQSLRKAIQSLNKTTIIISQRASSIMHADLILVLDQGRIVGKGTHADLLSTCDVYSEICDSQDVGGVEDAE
ncbi:MAG: ABC transporter ATP-binding protein/permease, partial [Anaeroplasmataceae bacterium]|nr:ABC transporter ATP-binding protein/permease [Anaeroplasmataceae bacterium]